MASSRFSIKAVFSAIDRVSAPVAKIQSRMGSLSKRITTALGPANKAIDSTTKKIASIGKVAGLAGVAAGAALLKLGSAGANFEEAISAVGAVGLQTREQIADLEKEALRLGAVTKFTATEAANAMEIMARAGFSNQEILAGVGGVLNAAAASGLEMAEVADHVSNVLKGMGLEASEAGRVADVLTVASSKTNSSIGSLGESMKNLSPVAKQFGIGLEDAIGMVALLQDVGMDASEAGTATATMLTKLAKPSDEIAKKMKQLGIAFQDAEGNMLPPLEIFGNMQQAADNLGGNMDQVAFFADLVGLRGQKAALNLKDLFTSEKGEQLTQALRSAEGAAEQMAKLRMDNLKGDLTLLGSAVDGVKVALFDLESGALRGVIQGMTEWIAANQELIVGGVQGFIQGIRDNLPTIVTWLERIGRVAAVFAAIAGVIKLIGLVATVIGALTNPVVWLLALIAGVAAFWPEIVEQVQLFVKDLEWIWDELVTWLKGLWAGVVSFFQGVWEGIVNAAEVAFEFLGTIVTFYVDFYSGLFRGIVAVFAWIWEQVSAGFKLAWDGISALAAFYVKTFTGAWSAIADFFTGLWASIQATFEAVMDAIIGRIEGAIGFLSENLGGVASFLGFGESASGPIVSAEPQMSNPHARALAEHRSLEERREVRESRLTIEDRTGRAKLDAPRRSPFNLKTAPSGGFN